jgi:hypothetical protein
MGLAQGYAQGGWSEAIRQGGIGLVAGAIGGAAGGLAGILARSAVPYLGIACGSRFSLLGGAFIGAAEGGAFGFADEFVRGGISTGTWAGAFAEARTNGLMGLRIGFGLGRFCIKFASWRERK